jgi:hypothetical protein
MRLVLGVGLLLACPARSADPAPATEAPLAAAPAVAEHPGTITFVDRDTGTVEEKPASDIPEGIAWVERDGVRIPVVRVESGKVGEAREILRYGPDGALLDTTVSAPRPPR